MCLGPEKKVTYVFVFASPAESLVHLTSHLKNHQSKWLYSCYFVGCCFKDLFKIACSILVLYQYTFFFMHFVTDHLLHPYSCIHTATAWKKSRLILSSKLSFHIIVNQSREVHAFTRPELTSLSVDETLP